MAGDEFHFIVSFETSFMQIVLCWGLLNTQDLVTVPNFL